VSILFADIVGFTAMAKSQPPDTVMELLNDLFTRWVGGGWCLHYLIPSVSWIQTSKIT
jgi:hypothetical protein